MRDEDATLQHAQMIIEAVALSQAMLDGDVQEARFRAGLIAHYAHVAGLNRVARAAGAVVERLGRGTAKPYPGYGQAIEALSIAISNAQN